MNETELKRLFPDTYNSIFNAGVKSERDRVKSWMQYADTNIEEVKQGITSGKSINSNIDQFYTEIDSKIEKLKIVD